MTKSIQSSIIDIAKEVRQINKEGCTVDFTNILLVNERYEIKDVVNFPKDLIYAKGKRAMLVRITRNNVSVSDPLAPKYIKTFSSRILINTGDFIISKGRIASGVYNHFAVTAQNNILPVGTIVHSPFKQDKESIYCYDTEGKPVRILHEYLTVLVPKKGKKQVKKPMAEIGLAELPDPKDLEIKHSNEVESTVVPVSETLALGIAKPVNSRSHVNVDTNIKCEFNGYKILNREVLQTIEKNTYIKEGVFSDLNGDVHDTLQSAIDTNSSIIALNIEESIKQAVLDSL